jgi:short-subunit dehydrogenase
MTAPVEYRGTWALVTGASSGIGAEFARRLAERGVNLFLVARSVERLERLASDLSRVNGIEARSLAVDLSTVDGPITLLDTVGSTGIFVEHVVNNAGFGSAGPFVSLDPSREASMVRLNSEAVVTLTRGFLEPMVSAGRGGVINVASTAAFQAVPYMATYGATKAFVLSFTSALVAELRGTGVRAMALCPGPVRTGFQAAAGIERPGIALAELTSRQTVESGLAAYDRGDAVCVPGFVNGVQAALSKLLPRGLVEWAAVRAMRRLGRTGKG